MKRKKNSDVGKNKNFGMGTVSLHKKCFKAQKPPMFAETESCNRPATNRDTCRCHTYIPPCPQCMCKSELVPWTLDKECVMSLDHVERRPRVRAETACTGEVSKQATRKDTMLEKIFRFSSAGAKHWNFNSKWISWFSLSFFLRGNTTSNNGMWQRQS